MSNYQEAPQFYYRSPKRTFFWASFVSVLVLVLIFILFPVFACGCREASPRSMSLANLKQMTLGAVMYAGDHDERWVSSSEWQVGLTPYVKNEELFDDPTNKPERFGYAMNQYAARVEADRVEAPETTVGFFWTIKKGPNAAGGRGSVRWFEGQTGVTHIDGSAKLLKVLTGESWRFVLSAER